MCLLRLFCIEGVKKFNKQNSLYNSFVKQNRLNSKSSAIPFVLQEKKNNKLTTERSKKDKNGNGDNNELIYTTTSLYYEYFSLSQK